MFQNFSLAIERTSVRCWFDNLGLYTFVKWPLFFTLRRYTFCDLTILTKLKLQLCVYYPRISTPRHVSPVLWSESRLHHGLVSVHHVLQSSWSLTSYFVGTFNNFRDNLYISLTCGFTFTYMIKWSKFGLLSCGQRNVSWYLTWTNYGKFSENLGGGTNLE